VCSEIGKERADTRGLSSKIRETGKKDDALERLEEMAIAAIPVRCLLSFATHPGNLLPLPFCTAAPVLV